MSERTLIFKKGNDPIEVKRIVVLIYGQPGVKKTSWAIKSSKPLLFDFEDGLIRVMAQHRLDSSGEEITYIPMSPVPDEKDTRGKVTKKGEPDGRFVWQRLMEADTTMFDDFDTLVFDSVSKMMEYAADYVKTVDLKNKKKNGDLSQAGWGALGQEFVAFKIKYLKNNKNIIFISHEKEEKEGENTKKRPDISGSSRMLITKEADFIGYMQVYNGKSTIGFTPTEGYYGKNSCGLPESFEADEMTVDDIINKYRESINANSKEYQKFKEQVEDFRNRIDSVEFAIDLNIVLEDFKLMGINKEFALTAGSDIWEVIQMKASDLKFTKEYENGKIKCYGEPKTETPQPAPESTSPPVETPPAPVQEEKPAEPQPVEVPEVPKHPKAPKNPK